MPEAERRVYRDHSLTKVNILTTLLLDTFGLDTGFAHLPWQAVPGKNAQPYSTNEDEWNYENSVVDALRRKKAGSKYFALYG